MSEKKYRLWSLFVENFMGVKLAEVEFNGDALTAIVGDNAAGKTSLLQAIAYGLGGDKLLPDSPIRNGEDRGEVTLNLQDYIVTRKLKRREDGKIETSLTVKSPDGMKYDSPQALLSGLINKLSIDALAFARDEDKQVDILKTLANSDFTILDRQRKTHYDNRAVVNTEVRGLRANVEKMHLVEAPDEPVSVEGLLKEQADLIAEARRFDALKSTAEEAARARARAATRVAAALTALLKAQAELAEAEAALVKTKESEEEAAGEVAVTSRPDLKAIEEKLRSAGATNELVRQKKARAEASRKLREKEIEAEALTKKIEDIDKNKREAIAAAQFPIPGLSFVEDETIRGATFDGVPFSQVNQATKIRVSMAVMLALNPKLPLVLIKDASLLGEQQMRIVSEMAEAAGAQVLLERVWRPGEVGIHIEAGLIVDGEKAA